MKRPSTGRMVAMTLLGLPLLGLGLWFVLLATARAETIGEVDTVFKLIGPDHKIVVEAHDDPKVGGITC